MKKTLFEPLRLKKFRILFSAQVISDLGNWLDFTALLVLFAYSWELGPGALALLTISIGLPGLILGPFTGVFVDKLPIKTVMIVSDLLRALAVFGLIFAPNFYIVLLLIVLRGTFTTFFDPARQSAIKRLVPEEQLLKASSLSQLSLNGSKIIGPALGSALLVFTTPQMAFLIDSISYTVSALLLLFLPKMTNEKQETTEKNKIFKGFWKDLREGLVFISNKKILLMLILFNGTVFFIVYLFDSLGVLLARDMGIEDSVFGIFISIVGVGALVGALTIGQWSGKYNHLNILSISAFTLGSMLILTGLGGFGYLPTVIPLWLAIWFIIGLSIGTISVCYGYLLQLHTPQQLMGRVSSSANALVNGAMVISPTIGSLLAIWIEVSGVFLTSGLLIMAVCGVVFFAYKQNRLRSVRQEELAK